MCKSYVCVDGLMLEIENGRVRPLSMNTGMSLVSSEFCGDCYDFDDSVLFFNDVLGFVRNIPLPKFYEYVLPYVHPEYAEVYFRNKAEFMSNYIVDYEDLTDIEKLNLYDDIQLQEPLKEFWYEETSGKDKALEFISLSAIAQHKEYIEGLARRNNIFTMTGEIMDLSSKRDVDLIKRDILKDRGSKALEYFIPVLTYLKVDFLDEYNKDMRQSYKTLVRAYTNEMYKDYNNNIKIVTEISDDNEDFYDEVDPSTTEGRLYFSIREGLFYVNDSSVADYSLGLRDFLYELICRLTALLEEPTKSEQIDFVETCVTEHSKDSFVRAKNRFSNIDDVCDNFELEQEVRTLDFNEKYVKTLTSLFKLCDDNFNQAVKHKDILNTKECLNVTSLCEYLIKLDDINGIANIIEQMKEDFVGIDIDKQAIRKALFVFYSDFILDKAFEILFGNDGVGDKVNVSMPRIGE